MQKMIALFVSRYHHGRSQMVEKFTSAQLNDVVKRSMIVVTHACSFCASSVGAGAPRNFPLEQFF